MDFYHGTVVGGTLYLGHETMSLTKPDAGYPQYWKEAEVLWAHGLL